MVNLASKLNHGVLKKKKSNVGLGYPDLVIVHLTYVCSVALEAPPTLKTSRKETLPLDRGLDFIFYNIYRII